MLIYFIIGLSVAVLLLFIFVPLISWIRNRMLPVRSTEAVVVSKNMVQGHQYYRSNRQANRPGGYPVTTPPSCYAAFQLDDGKRLEFHIPDDDFGIIVEGDRGILVYQGSLYRGFNRFQ